MNLKEYLEKMAALVESALGDCLPPPETYPPSLHQAMFYSLFAGGKRLRPVLALAAAEAVGGKAEDALPAACALELIHTYSLIHDDLPAMDDDDLRRGKPTCHRAFGEGVAILAGDALLTQAFLFLSRLGLVSRNSRAFLQVLVELAEAAGSTGMVGGQVVDLSSEGQPVDLATLDYIHRHKTGSLFVASLRAGAILAGANSNQMQAITAYGGHYGLAFQITDDILNVVGNSYTMGKTAGSDQERGKATFPSLYGLEESRRRAQEEIQRALADLEVLGSKAWILEGLANALLAREK